MLRDRFYLMKGQFGQRRKALAQTASLQPCESTRPVLQVAMLAAADCGAAPASFRQHLCRRLAQWVADLQEPLLDERTGREVPLRHRAAAGLAFISVLRQVAAASVCSRRKHAIAARERIRDGDD